MCTHETCTAKHGNHGYRAKQIVRNEKQPSITIFTSFDSILSRD